MRTYIKCIRYPITLTAPIYKRSHPSDLQKEISSIWLKKDLIAHTTETYCLFTCVVVDSHVAAGSSRRTQLRWNMQMPGKNIWILTVEGQSGVWTNLNLTLCQSCCDRASRSKLETTDMNHISRCLHDFRPWKYFSALYVAARFPFEEKQCDVCTCPVEMFVVQIYIKDTQKVMFR